MLLNNIVDDLEEDKEPAQEYEGLNRKQKKMLKSMQTAHSVKKMLFVQPEKEWTILKGKSVYMESNKDEAGDKIFEFIEREPYKEVQSEFRSIQQSFDIFMMMDFMHKNMFHHQTLITVSDFLRMQGKFPDAVKLINRWMYAFEILFSKDFVIWGPKPQTRINFNSEKSVLPQVLADWLVRYIDHLGRKGCWRTALEFTKFFLSLDPVNDPFGNLLKIDFYSLRCGEYKYLSTFAEKFSTEFYSHPMKTILFTPNLLLSTALAKYKLSDPWDDRTKILDKAHSDLNILGSLIHEYAWEESPKILKQIYSFSAEGLIMLGLIFYPTLIKQIIIKLEADKKPNTKKSFFKGHQSDPWSKIIEHNMFEYSEDDEVLEHSLGLDSEVLSKYFDLYVDRSFEWYKDDDVLDWLKQVIGYVLNEVDQDNFDRDVQFQFIFNTIGLPFELKRYSNLKKDFFNDDFTTVRPQDLLGPNAAAGNNELGGMNNAAMQANLRQMLNNRNLPPQVANAIRNQGVPRGNQDNLIIEDPNAVHEQELIMQHIAQQLRPNEEEEGNFLSILLYF